MTMTPAQAPHWTDRENSSHIAIGIKGNLTSVQAEQAWFILRNTMPVWLQSKDPSRELDRRIAHSVMVAKAEKAEDYEISEVEIREDFRQAVLDSWNHLIHLRMAANTLRTAGLSLSKEIRKIDLLDCVDVGADVRERHISSLIESLK
jgi:hypothetical protein